MLSHRLACEASDVIAAIGPVAGTMAFDGCAPSRPVPVMHFHGTSDFVVLYNGGGFSNGDSVPDTIDDWAMRNGCSGAAVTTFDMGKAKCENHGNCTAGADITLCTLTDGGHQWPGGMSAGPGGEINMDISASAAMLDFFTAHPMP
jgi:polyhydroxybutyrate depolymerase